MPLPATAISNLGKGMKGYGESVIALPPDLGKETRRHLYPQQLAIAQQR